MYTYTKLAHKSAINPHKKIEIGNALPAVLYSFLKSEIVKIGEEYHLRKNAAQYYLCCKFGL